ncbi:hypothetical protein A2U01_0114017, partial [Trifolium medium]|nr:hypothetical protein [Trifolium medium]
VDAHRIGDGRWGLGLLLRRGDGSCVGVETKAFQCSKDVKLAEAMGLRAAIEWIERERLDRVVVELDTQV